MFNIAFVFSVHMTNRERFLKTEVYCLIRRKPIRNVIIVNEKPFNHLINIPKGVGQRVPQTPS